MYGEARGMSHRHVLLITEDVDLQLSLRALLARVSSVLWERRCLVDAVQLAAQRRFDLLMLDLRSGGVGGVEATRRVRQQTNDALVALAGPADEGLELDIFEAGADDLLTLPLELDLLPGKLKILSRSGIHSTERAVLETGAPLELDREAQELRCQGRAVHLTPSELKLLRTLSAFPGRFVSPRRLSLELWGSSSLQRVEQLQIKMRQLRRKLDRLRQQLVVEPALGYSLHLTAELVPV